MSDAFSEVPILPTLPPSLGDRLESLLLRGVLAWMGRGTLPEAYARAERLSRWGRRVLRKEWNWTLTNLRWVYGDQLSPAQRERLAIRIFENIFDSHLEGMRVQEVEVQCPGLERMRRALGEGRGGICCSIHLGGWEPALRLLGERGIPMAVVYRHANNPLSDQLFSQVRGAYGPGLTWHRRADVRGILRALQGGRVLGLMTDINAREGGVTVPFLGIPAQSMPGPARLAQRFKVPVVPVLCVRDAPGRATLHILDPLEPQRGDDGGAETVEGLLFRINGAFEPWIHEYAEQYNWLHARWRSRPDGALWRPDAPWEALQAARCAPFAPVSERVRRMLALEG
ncbi:MAG: lysophospholipid acyltransferase family protein [Magnetococcales bacterium]|nr:lysophospholipid acyltransferase family protein [Magnetococcales bacterium]